MNQLGSQTALRRVYAVHRIARPGFSQKNYSILTNKRYLSISDARRKNHQLIQQRLLFTSIPKIIGKSLKLPTYVGGGLAAAGSYVAYKVEEASNYTNDKLSQLKDLSSDAYDKASKFFEGWGDSGGSGGAAGNAGASGNPNGGNNNDPGATLGTAAAIMGVSADDEDDQPEDEDNDNDDNDNDNDDDDNDSTDDQMLSLTRQMIEIRSILQEIDKSSDTLKLPSIVVIGSQSSGKSSVLEAIVGQEFLPKGSNMVTRRPIELTLVNTPNSASETADFPALKMFNLTDFNEVQKILFDLNMAVPESEAISNDPIQLIIKSPTIPDLSLVDLPGYIQVEAADQPVQLKNKIKDLCSRYLENPNIILAISSADVDLANSSALKASKQADPKGERTIGVITKLDLVEPEVAKSILMNEKYPLKMGYVGVITKAPSKTGSIFKRKNSNHDAFMQQQSFESKYFKSHRDIFGQCNVSTKVLKKKLVKVLERTMSLSLGPTSLLVQQELDDTSYKFKVEFNDRPLTPKTYLAENIDLLKLSIKEFNSNFGRNELKSILRNELDQNVLNLLASRYWNKYSQVDSISKEDTEILIKNLSNLNDLKVPDSYWLKKLELTTNSLTKLGIGRLSTTLITNSILSEINNIIEQSQLKNHPLMKDVVFKSAEHVLNSRFTSTADQVENCIKPYKYEIDIEDREWNISRDHTIRLMKEELKQCNESYQYLKNSIGGRKLNQVVKYIEDGEINFNEETLGFSKILIQKGYEAIFLKNRSTILNFRLKALKSSSCKSKENKFKCPEIFLNVVNDKLTTTAILFLNVELLSDFFYKFPRELDQRLNSLTEEEIENFAKEDPKIKRHIELQQRKELLELALTKIDGILSFQRNNYRFNKSK